MRSTRRSPAAVATGGGPGEAFVPVTTFFECNLSEFPTNVIPWDTAYDVDQDELFPSAPNDPHERSGLSWNFGGANPERVTITEGGLYACYAEVDLRMDDTASVLATMNVPGDYYGVAMAYIPDVSDATWVTIPGASLGKMGYMQAGGFIRVTASAERAPTAPGYRPVSYAALKVIRLA